MMAWISNKILPLLPFDVSKESDVVIDDDIEKKIVERQVILLKKKLNQAKIHIIHKLTRKAKTLTAKKAPDHLKEKLKKKAVSAVNEVLIIKKIKPRDIAKFMITHTGEVKDYLNRPNVDNDKACARLVLHKSLEDKYKFIRNRFGNVPIKDLFMSRLERRKLKKEAREQQKNKKKAKERKVSNSAGDWDVDDIDMGDDSKDISQNDDNNDEGSDDESNQSDVEDNVQSADENDIELDDAKHHVAENMNSRSVDNDSDDDAVDDIDEIEDDIEENNDDLEQKDNQGDDDDNSDDVEENIVNFVKLTPQKANRSDIEPKSNHKEHKNKITETSIPKLKTQEKKRTDKKGKEKKQTNLKVKENKNKNLKEKLQNRQFKKDKEQTQNEGRKVVDPFFITATGENYLSLAEPRQPDEVKEVHKQGNRQERRAAMFGHVAKMKPRKGNFEQNNFRSNKFGQDGVDNGPLRGFKNNNDRFSDGNNLHDRNNRFNDRNSKFNDRNTKFNDRNATFNDKNSKFNDSRNTNIKDRNFNDKVEKKEDKLHPSWEAKRKLKSMSLLPAQGKKIVFNDN